MPLSEGDKAIIEKTAYEVGETVTNRLKEHFELQMQLHVANCPLKQTVVEGKAVWKTICAVAGCVMAFGALIIEYIRK